MRDLKYYAQKSLTAKKSRSLECDVTLEADGEKFHAYEVSIANQDLLFFTDKGTLNYLVDNYGGDARAELFNVERD